MNNSILEINNISVYFKKKNGTEWTIEDINLNLKKGEILGIIGESGSGKTLLINSILRPYKHNIKTRFDGEIIFEDKNLFDFNDTQLRSICGKKISMIFQNPQSSLNPHITLGDQLLEAIVVSKGMDHPKKRITQILQKVEFDEIDRVFLSYPNEFSGGQLQRFCIAMALVNNPEILLADEPTTALDVFHQYQIIQLLKKLSIEFQLSIIIVTHELSIAHALCDNIAVMRAGRIIEYKSKKDLFENPEHDFTKTLVQIFPNIKLTQNEMIDYVDKKPEIAQAPNLIMRLENITKIYQGNRGIRNISFDLYQGECLGILGRSGSGKSTIAKILSGLTSIDSGKLFWEDKDISNFTQSQLRPLRSLVQLVFQNPYLSLNPAFTCFRTLENAIEQHYLLSGIQDQSNKQQDIFSMLDLVELNVKVLEKFPHQISGGEQQRLSLARALIMRPKVIICDEATSSLDASIRFALLKKLKEIQLKLNMTIVNISHNLMVTADIADRIFVIHQGALVETTNSRKIFKEQIHQETKKILESNCLIV